MLDWGSWRCSWLQWWGAMQLSVMVFLFWCLSMRRTLLNGKFCPKVNGKLSCHFIGFDATCPNAQTWPPFLAFESVRSQPCRLVPGWLLWARAWVASSFSSMALLDRAVRVVGSRTPPDYMPITCAPWGGQVWSKPARFADEPFRNVWCSW